MPPPADCMRRPTLLCPLQLPICADFCLCLHSSNAPSNPLAVAPLLHCSYPTAESTLQIPVQRYVLRLSAYGSFTRASILLLLLHVQTVRVRRIIMERQSQLLPSQAVKLGGPATHRMLEPPCGSHETFLEPLSVLAMSLEASILRMVSKPSPALSRALEMTVAASASPSALMTDA